MQQLVSKLSETQSVAGFAVEPTLHGILGHHIVDGNMLTHFAGEVEEGIILHPIIVVNQLGAVGRIALKVEEAAQLLLDAFHIVA